MKRLGPYDLVRRLGTGATAEVWLAAGPNPRNAPWLALKVMLPHLAEDPSNVNAMLREAQTTFLFHHPNLVELFDVKLAEGRPYLAMEWVDGGSVSSLEKRLASLGERVELGVACEIVRQAALGLHHLHEARGRAGEPLGLVHRDVSSNNVLLSRDGAVKVADFGVAKATLAAATQTRGLRGTLAYMPPEQLQSKPLDRRADVYSLGAILWELACGRRLCPGPSDAEVLQQAFFLPQPHPDEVATGLPRALVSVLQRAVERDLTSRLPDARSLAEALAPLCPTDARDRLVAQLSRALGPASGADESTQPGTEPPRPAPPSNTLVDELPSDTIETSASTGGYEAATAPDRTNPVATRPTGLAPRRWSGRATMGLLVLILAGLAGVVLWRWLPKVRWPASSPDAPSLTPPDARAGPAVDSGVRPTPEETPRPHDKVRPRSRPGSLTVRSDAPAFLYEKGTALGMTPVTLTLPAGRHTLEVRSPDGSSSTSLDVLIPPGGEVVREVHLP